MQEHEIGIDLHMGLGPDVEAAVEKQIDEIKAHIDFREDLIRVNPFFVEHLNAGIRPLPEDLEDYLHRPESFPEEDAESFREDIKAWKDAGKCVLIWGNEYDLDNEGFAV